MGTIDNTYRISKSIKNSIKDFPQYHLAKSELKRAQNPGSISVDYHKCDIDEDWVLEIKEKLPYVENAVEEGRHALKTEGNVVRMD